VATPRYRVIATQKHDNVRVGLTETQQQQQAAIVTRRDCSVLDEHSAVCTDGVARRTSPLPTKPTTTPSVSPSPLHCPVCLLHSTLENAAGARAGQRGNNAGERAAACG